MSYTLHCRPALSMLLSTLIALASYSDASAQTPMFPPGIVQRSEQPAMAGTQSSRLSDCTIAEQNDPMSDCNSDLIPRSTSSTSSVLGATPDAELDVPGAQDGFPLQARQPQRAITKTKTAPIEEEPPTEFQRYVANSLGRTLPIYGARLFERVPSTFAPLDHTPVGADYRIAPGDELQITVWGKVNFSRRQVVDRNGQIAVPEAGPVSVAGLGFADASPVIKASLSHLYREFDVSVTLSRLHAIQVFVLGEARRPGSYSVSALSTLVNAVFASGGPSARGSMRSIELRRGNQTVCDLDLYDLLMRGDKSMDAPLLPGDVIFIPPAGPQVAVTGSVQHEAIYEIEPNATVSDIFRLGNGISSLASHSDIVLERMGDSAGLQEIHLKANSADLKQPVQDGDILRVLPLVPRFQNAVTLRGNVVDPGRYPWHAGMRLSELIPSREVLRTREYWLAQNDLGSAAQGTALSETSSTPKSMQQEENPQPPGSLTPPDPATRLLAVNAPVKTIPYEDQERHTGGDASLAAATELDAVPPLRRFKPRNTIQPSAPDVYWEYAAIARTDQATLETRTIAFNLGKLVLNHDNSQDLELLPGDVVTIFSKADFSVPRSQQPAQVRVEGEVKMAGVYTVHPGETLRYLITRAGGVTREAYVYGAQFTRESTRREQQKRYEDFLNQLERDINQSASSLSSRVTSPQQAATAQTSIASQRDLLESLRKVAMNGRIVLNISPNDRGIGAFPDMPLENGDRLYIPSRPSTVNVVGNVYEQSSFLYEEDYRSGEYLKKAGGPTRDADRSHMFIVRADGSVVSRHVNAPLFANSFDGLRMNPGDTLVVPTYLNRSTLVRNLLDWSQILSNFGLGAAAINVLR